MKDMPIDLVLPWVDDKDPAWLEERSRFLGDNTVSATRYESWDNLQYIFRAIEQNMPWVRYVFFVTWGHVPSWLNQKYSHIRVVRHRDYIPKEYLPTFNSNVIEMNYHRIKELSENFILFNDDLIPLRPIEQKYYFQHNLPCEEAVETHFVLKEGVNQEISPWWNYSNVNNMIIINRHFNKKQVIAENYDKWFNPIYGERMKHNLAMYYWHDFESFVYPHEATPMKKSVLREIWEKEEKTLYRACHNRFRASSDVTQRLITLWQICSGKFVPHKFQGKFFLAERENLAEILTAIQEQKYPLICLNEKTSEEFSLLKREVNAALKALYPHKSSFEL